MTLFKQLALIVTTGVFVLLILISMDNFQRTSHFVETQMQTSAQDVATTLGIAISTTKTGNDSAALEAYFNALFDSGYYSQIRLVGVDGSIIHEKKRDVSIDGIPDWFIQLVPLSSSTGKANVLQGWVTLGTLEVTVHTALAYAELYDNVKHSLTWFLCLFLLILSVLWFDLHIQLKPLGRIKEQAQAIHKNRFIKQDTLPKTVELRSVVEAMNHMITKVQKIFVEQEQTLARCHDLIYIDELTGLGNRKRLVSQLNNSTLEESDFNGSIIVFKLYNLNELSEQSGYLKVDACINNLVNILTQRTQHNTEEHVARMSEHEFALLAPFDAEQANQAVDDITQQFKLAESNDSINAYMVAASTGVQSGQEIGAILANLDMALSQSLSLGPYAYRRAGATTLVLPQGKAAWRTWFKETLLHKKFYLVGQPVFNAQKERIQQELFIRVHDTEEHVIPAGIFMPMAHVLGLDLDVDRMVFCLLNEQLDKTADAPPYALNLSVSFFQRADALEEFKRLLDSFHTRSQILCVEASHQAYVKSPHMFKQIAETVKKSGNHFGIDHLDLTVSMDTLQTIQPNYVKISAGVLEDLRQEPALGAYQALHTLTSALDIHIIAVGVDKTELLEHLISLGIEGMQGNYLGKPEALL